MTKLSRRSVLALGVGGLALAGAVPLLSKPAHGARIAVIGGGSAGTAAALHVRSYLPGAAITLIERDPTELVRSATSRLPSRPTVDFAALKSRDIHVALDEARGVDWSAKEVAGVSGRSFGFDHLVVAPGVAARAEDIDGYDARAAHLMPHAWLRRETAPADLERRLEALPQGATMVIRVPAGAISHPTGPYARATAMAERLAQINPSAKVLILDAKTDFTGRAEFEARWSQPDLAGRLEWLSAGRGGRVLAVDGDAQTLLTEAGSLSADLINFIPAQQAGEVARSSGLVDASGWCPVGGSNMNSTVQAAASVIGDAVLASAESKTASSAVQQARSCAANLAMELT